MSTRYSSTPSTSASTSWRALSSSSSRTLSANGLASASRSFSASSPISCAQKPAKPNQAVSASPHQLTLHLVQRPRKAGISPLAPPLLQVLVYCGVGIALRLLLVGFPTVCHTCFATPVPRVAAPGHLDVTACPVHGNLQK